MYFLFVGDTNVGKSTIIQNMERYLNYTDSVVEPLMMTIGIRTHTLDFSDDITLRVLDTGEYYQYQDTIELFLKFVAAVFVVYDIHSKESFRYAIQLYLKFRTQKGFKHVYLLGNNKQTSGNQPEWRCAETIEVSGKTGENVKETMDKIVERIQEESAERIAGLPNIQNPKECCCFF